MKNLGKNLIIILVLAVSVMLFSACETSSSALTFEDIAIKGENVENIESGPYSLRYTIENLEKYKRQNTIDVVVSVTDKHNQPVSVINNRIITVEENNTYLVTILVTSGTRTKTHDYTVVAVKSQITVTFASGEFENFEDFNQTFYYGDALVELPELPGCLPDEEDKEVIDSYWTLENPSDLGRLPDRLFNNDLNNLTQDITIYAFYQIAVPDTYTISFVTDEGTQIDDIESVPFSAIELPDIPTKENQVFFGWYEDEDLTQRYFFKGNHVMPAKSFTLYARWIDQIENATPEKYFEYETVDNELMKRLGWLKISAKDPTNMPENLVIPRFINNKPVVEIDTSGFAICSQIKTVVIPYTIGKIGISAFNGHASDTIAQMSLNTVEFENTTELTVIKTNAFANNQELKTINIPDSIKTIGRNAFENCAKLETVTFGEDSVLENIYEKAFYGCEALENIILPSSLKRIDGKAFFNCTSLQTVTFQSQVYVELSGDSDHDYAFGYLEDGVAKRLSIVIYVPADALEIYEAYEHMASYNIQPIDASEIS